MYKIKPKSKKYAPAYSNRLKRGSGDDPPLTGWVLGKKASDIEERFARACRNNYLGFWFQVPFAVLGTLPGDDKIIDFVLDTTIKRTVDVDGEFSHKTAEQIGKDHLRDALLNNELVEMGFQVPHLRIEYWRLEDQEAANRTVRNILSGAL